MSSFPDARRPKSVQPDRANSIIRISLPAAAFPVPGSAYRRLDCCRGEPVQFQFAAIKAALIARISGVMARYGQGPDLRLPLLRPAWPLVARAGGDYS